MIACSLCEGKLFINERHRGRDNDEIWKEEACSRCLSVPVDDALQAFAKEWLGCDFWTRSVVNGTVGELNHAGSGWWGEQVAADDWGRSDTLNGRQKVVPLWLPAGTDLGVRWLARYLAVGHRAILEALDHPDPHAILSCWLYSSAVQGGPGDDLVQALATIPRDAPPHLRAARALALCLEVSP